MKPINLRCNNIDNPLGVDSRYPYFSWRCEPDSLVPPQTGYRILVSAELLELEREDGAIWDSGEVSSDASIGIAFDGRSLVSCKRYWWKVRIRNTEEGWGEWSDSAWFETGLLNPEDWSAKWIQVPVPRFPPKQEVSSPAPYIRKSATISEMPVRARAYVSGLGYYEMYVNGRKCGDRVLSPPVSQYDRTVYYDCLDILEHIQSGENVFGTILGNGWYNPNADDAWNFQKAPWRDSPKLLLQIELSYADGRTEKILSDTSWKLSEGPIRFDGLKNGEFYDARLELDGWCEAGYNDDNWEYAQIAHPPGGVLHSSSCLQLGRCACLIRFRFIRLTGILWFLILE